MDALDSITATLVDPTKPHWSCICGQPYPVQRPMDFHAELAGTKGRVTKGSLRVRTFCTVPGCGQGSIEVKYTDLVEI